MIRLLFSQVGDGDEMFGHYGIFVQESLFALYAKMQCSCRHIISSQSKRYSQSSLTIHPYHAPKKPVPTKHDANLSHKQPKKTTTPQAASSSYVRHLSASK